MKLVVIRDADELLVQEMLAPLPLEQARSSLEFWRERRKVLPFYRRGERRKRFAGVFRFQRRPVAVTFRTTARYVPAEAGRVKVIRPATVRPASRA